MVAIIAVACCVGIPLAVLAVAGITGMMSEGKAIQDRGVALSSRIRNFFAKG